MENPLNQIDWSLLRNQKTLLLETINNNAVSPMHKKALEGILHLIDAVQDYAVDEMGISEMHVFDFEQEEGIIEYEFTSRCEESATPKTKVVIVCANCNSDNVELKHWVNANTNEVGACTEDEEDTWCNDCETHGGVYAAELKEDAKVIGYQVVSDGLIADYDGELHPDMDASFCIYSLSQARDMINDDKGAWKLQTIWEGDIEEPTIMYVGDVRD